MKKCPICYRTYSDETFNFCLEDGSLLNTPNEPEVETVISQRKEIVSSFSSITTAIIDDPVIAINIAQQYPHVKNVEELYNCTRGLWRLSKQRAENAQYAFAVYKGEIKEVYKIDYWEPAKFDSSEFWVNKKREQGVEIDPKVNEGRFQFIGSIASEEIRNKYIGKIMPIAHAQNPIRYFNC
jgi:hypothetical protein